MMPAKALRTVDLARAVGLSTEQVRNYEAVNLLPPVPRSESGYRLYTERHLEALRVARAMIAAGYRQHQIADIMQAVHRGDIAVALAAVDARHAALDEQRRQVERTLEAIQALIAAPVMATGRRESRNLRIGEAAREAGVRSSALRFWEQQGLLNPTRDPVSGYRVYDRRQVRRLHVVVLLRRAGYDFDAIRSVLDELMTGSPASTLRAVEERRDEIAATSRACAEATAALWSYACTSPSLELPDPGWP